MPEWEIDKLILFIAFVIPGFISLKVYELIFPSNFKDTTKQIIDAIAYSSINYAILIIPIISIHESNLKENLPFLYYSFFIFVLLIAPIIWVFIWKYLRESKLFQRFSPHPVNKAWDYIFSQKKSYWIKITLINGKVIGGFYHTKSFTSHSPYPEQIYLEECWILNKHGGFKKAKNRTSGVLIMQNQISYIEFQNLGD